MTDIYQQTLLSGVAQLGLSVDEQAVNKLLAYHRLLIKWNKTYNLTAVRNPLHMVGRHLLDSLSLVPHIQGRRFIDVGTGAGLPGIVLAIVFPEYSFDLLDSNGKKTRFLTQAVAQLGLGNVRVHQCRVEQFLPGQPYEGVVTRAFSTLADMVQCCSHLLAQHGKFYAMKGIYPAQELSELEKTYKVNACHPLQVPGEEGARHLVVLSTQIKGPKKSENLI